MTEPRKECFKCHTVKSLSEFYKHKQMADGHLNKCKDCAKQDMWNDRHVTKTERVRAYDSLRSKTIKRRELSKSVAKKYIQKHPGRNTANRQLQNAVNRGEIIKPSNCQICGAPNPGAHHHDYNKPFDVVWACGSCHRKIHIQIDRGELPPIIDNAKRDRTQGKRVAVIDDNGNIQEVSPSMKALGFKYSICESNIASVCKGKRKRAGGMKFRFLTHEEYEAHKQ